MLLRFRENHNRYPQSSTADNDVKELFGLRDTVLDELKVDKEQLPEDFAGYVHVCSLDIQ